MKYLLVLLTLVLSACGQSGSGGGSADPTVAITSCGEDSTGVYCVDAATQQLYVDMNVQFGLDQTKDAIVKHSISAGTCINATISNVKTGISQQQKCGTVFNLTTNTIQ